MTDPEHRYHNPELRTAIGAPVQGSEAPTTPTSPEVDAHAQAVAAAQAEEAKTGPSHRVETGNNRANKGVAIALAGTLGVGGTGAVALEATNVIDVIPNWPAAHAPANPNTNPDDGPDGIDSGKIVIELSPESIQGMTPEQLTEEFSIPAVDADGNPVTPEAYLPQFVENYEGALNAGITTEDMDPYISDDPDAPSIEKVGYEEEVSAKYDPLTGAALFTEGADQGGLNHNHKNNLLVAQTGVVIGADGTYAENVELADDFKVTVPPTSETSGFDVEFTLHFTNNAEELGIADFYEAAGNDISGDERTVTYTMHVDNIDGKLKSTGLRVIS